MEPHCSGIAPNKASSDWSAADLAQCGASQVVELRLLIGGNAFQWLYQVGAQHGVYVWAVEHQAGACSVQLLTLQLCC